MHDLFYHYCESESESESEREQGYSRLFAYFLGERGTIKNQ